MVVSFCSTSDPALLKNTIEKHSYIPVKMGAERRSVVECNRHNWCSVGVTTAPFFCVYPVYVCVYVCVCVYIYIYIYIYILIKA